MSARETLMDARPRCRHGYLVDECPYSTMTCNYSHEYRTSLSVPPPAGSFITPKQAEWEAERGN